jgi:mannose-6-phosphate isomerase
MGTHINGCAKIITDDSNIPLNEYLLKISEGKLNELAFMFKVLSVNYPLSIQVHPTKEFAIFLNKNYPDIYKDDNPKPEVSVALSDEFTMLYGFSSIEDAVEIITIFRSIFKKYITTNIDDIVILFYEINSETNGNLFSFTSKR